MGKLARVAPPKLTTEQWNRIFGTENEIYIYLRIFVQHYRFFLSFYFSVITTRKSVNFEQLSKLP